RRDRPDIAVRYYYKGVLWSPGYFASSCGGAPISAIHFNQFSFKISTYI
ncbi:hypothetical protein VC158_25640, partial [Escherichia coli]|nr:hypothetical protein [Escherichia coli]